MDAAHDFRNRQKTFSIAKTKGSKGAKDANAEKPAQVNPVKGTIYVAKTFPQWQQIVLDTLKTMYSVS
jgi:hypothetical protein